MHIGAVEAGGTKFRAAIFDPDLNMLSEARVDTAAPDETLHAVTSFFTKSKFDIAALGIASFGPLILDPESPSYGTFAPTPKPGWSGIPILQRLQQALRVPTAIQTDVEAAALAEQQSGAGVGARSVAYVTVGTGVGIGLAIDGQIFRGRDHLELGHMPVQRHSNDDFAGVCPFHGDCLEGLASGPALNKRWGERPSALDGRDDVWSIEADYLAQLACVLTWAFSPDRILISGGVGAREHFAPRVQQATIERLAGYSVSHATNANLVATAALGNDAGLIGAGLLGASLL